MVGDLLPLGYDRDDYDYKNKRQILEEIVDTAGDIVGDLTPFSYEGDRYDADEDYKVKRQVRDQCSGTSRG